MAAPLGSGVQFPGSHTPCLQLCMGSSTYIYIYIIHIYIYILMYLFMKCSTGSTSEVGESWPRRT